MQLSEAISPLGNCRSTAPHIPLIAGLNNRTVENHISLDLTELRKIIQNALAILLV